MPMAKDDEDTINMPCARYAQAVLDAAKSRRFDVLFMEFKYEWELLSYIKLTPM